MSNIQQLTPFWGISQFINLSIKQIQFICIIYVCKQNLYNRLMYLSCCKTKQTILIDVTMVTLSMVWPIFLSPEVRIDFSCHKTLPACSVVVCIFYHWRCGQDKGRNFIGKQVLHKTSATHELVLFKGY